jgi:hypothetical protein
MNLGNEPVFPGSARAPGCWLWRLAATDFSGEAKSRHDNLSECRPAVKKFAMARRHRQHARARALPRILRSLVTDIRVLPAICR